MFWAVFETSLKSSGSPGRILRRAIDSNERFPTSARAVQPVRVALVPKSERQLFDGVLDYLIYVLVQLPSRILQRRFLEISEFVVGGHRAELCHLDVWSAHEQCPSPTTRAPHGTSTRDWPARIERCGPLVESLWACGGPDFP